MIKMSVSSLFLRFMMRLPSSLMLGLLLLSTSPSYASSVLVPGESDSGSKNNNLGLIPVQPSTPVTKTTQPSAPSVMPPADSTASQPTTAAAGSRLDSVDMNLLKNVRIDELRKTLPPEMQGLSDAEISKLLNYNADKMKQFDVSKYVMTDPKTGAQTLDFDRIGKDSEQPSNVQISTGGGRIEPKVMTKQEQMLARFAAMGATVKQDPLIEKAQAMARAEREEEEKKHERSSLFLNDLDMESYDSPLLKSSLAIGLAKDYVWGQEALAIVNRTMGYTGDEILSNCQLRLNIYVNTDDGKALYKMALYSNTQKNVKYDGVLQNIEATPLAVCVKPQKPIPRHGNIIFKIGDKYGVSVPKVTCTAPQPDPSKKPITTLLISYTGDAKVECFFK